MSKIASVAPTEIVRDWNKQAEDMLWLQIERDLQQQGDSHFCYIPDFDEDGDNIYRKFPQKLTRSCW